MRRSWMAIVLLAGLPARGSERMVHAAILGGRVANEPCTLLTCPSAAAPVDGLSLSAGYSEFTAGFTAFGWRVEGGALIDADVDAAGWVAAKGLVRFGGAPLLQVGMGFAGVWLMTARGSVVAPALAVHSAIGFPLGDERILLLTAEGARGMALSGAEVTFALMGVALAWSL